MNYDTDYENIEQVSILVEESPGMGELGDLSADVVDLLVDIHMHVDAMVGYADWYVHSRQPNEIDKSVFLSGEYRQRLTNMECRITRKEDTVALKRIEEAARFLDRLTKLMFK